MTTRPTTDGDTRVELDIAIVNRNLRVGGKEALARLRTRISEQEVELERYRREMEANGQLYDEQLAMFRAENERYHSALARISVLTQADALSLVGIARNALTPTTQDPMREDVT